MKLDELVYPGPKTAAAQDKKTIKAMRASGTIMPKGHFHKKGEDWESTKVVTMKEGYNGDWAILPATMELYGKRTVDIIKAASEWDEATILVCKNEQGRICFVSSAGGEKSYDYHKGEVGKSFSTHHDQTGASKGDYTVLNVVWVKGDDIVKKVNDEGLKTKASLAVFK